MNKSGKVNLSPAPIAMPSNCLVCHGGLTSAPNLNNIPPQTTPEFRQSYYNFNPYRPDNTPDWYAFGGRANWGFASSTIALEKIVGKSRVTTYGSALKLYRPTINGNVFKGNQFTRTIALSKVAQGLGIASFWLGFAMDVKGSYNYIFIPNSTNTVHPGKALVNTGFGIVGTWGGSIGASVGTVYFGVDNFYESPGGQGWSGWFNGANDFQNQIDNGFNNAGPYRYNIMGAHEPK